MSLLGGPTAGAGFDGPWLGLDGSSVYLAWVLEVRERGDVKDFTFYQAFPQPTLSQRDGTEMFDYPSPDVTGEAVQVTIQGADPARTGNPDSDGHLHLAWIDTAGFSRYQVIYASTSPQIKETLNRVTTYEVVDKVLSVGMNVFSSLFFVPVVLSWVLIPIAGLVIFALTTREFEISDPRGRGAFGLACLLQLGIKVFFFSDLLSRFPSGSLISPSMDLLLGRWIFPLFLAALSAGMAWVFYLKSGRTQSIFVAYFIYATVDSFLTLVFYVALPMMG
jgi:hypothetical protein